MSPRPAAADGAASTRNILFGAAAAAAGTLIIINHNKKVHQKYAEYDQRQAQTQAEASQAQAAYESERQAYGHEAALVGEYQREVAYQHKVVERQDRQIASLEHSLTVAKLAARSSASTGFVRAAARPVAASSSTDVAQASPADVSYGWGTF